MKYYITLFVSVMVMTFISTHPLEDFNITLQPKWINLDQTNDSECEFGGKWILAGSITFKKKIKEQVSIKQIIMKWTGGNIDNLVASLYKKDLGKDFVPIEDNVVCDGVWHKTKQTLIFNFEDRETLGPITVFYLVLTVPESLEPILATGSFCIDERCLPEPFKECTQDKSLLLAIETITSEK